MEIGERVKLVILALTVAFYMLLELVLFARALTAFVSRRRSVKGLATANGLNRDADVEFESGMRGVLGGSKKVHPWALASVSARPPQEAAGVKAQAVKSGSGEPRAA